MVAEFGPNGRGLTPSCHRRRSYGVAVRFMEYQASASVPNVVVDGSPNGGTVLALTHWPGYPQPAGFEFDLSAQMAFELARRAPDLRAATGADVVTNNHFDQDGAVSVAALVDPAAALAHEALLVDVAAAGDFATYHDRRAARASMAIAALSDPDRSPFAAELSGPYDEQCAVAYARVVPMLVALAVDPEPWRDLWAEEDAALTAHERALADGSITVAERPEVELAVVTVGAGGGAGDRPSHRFTIPGVAAVHPMALYRATSSRRVLVVDRSDMTMTYTDRYETWVQYRSRPPLPRVDLRPLAAALTADDTVAWSADAPSALTPELRTQGATSLGETDVVDRIVAHLRAAPPAWDPYRDAG